MNINLHLTCLIICLLFGCSQRTNKPYNNPQVTALFKEVFELYATLECDGRNNKFSFETYCKNELSQETKNFLTKNIEKFKFAKTVSEEIILEYRDDEYKIVLRQDGSVIVKK